MSTSIEKKAEMYKNALERVRSALIRTDGPTVWVPPENTKTDNTPKPLPAAAFIDMTLEAAELKQEGTI